jgi:hydrogenase maturation protease
VDLIIGIGNRLRRDDGIGPEVVEALAARPGVERRIVHQLTPDLAPCVAEAERVLFVDASIGWGEMHLARIEVGPAGGLGHALSPTALLGLVVRLYRTAPAAWVLSVPGTDFEFGEALSPQASARLPEVTRRIEAWIEAPSAVAAT